MSIWSRFFRSHWFQQRRSRFSRAGSSWEIRIVQPTAAPELLETRVMLAGNITAAVSKGILTITGSTDADKVKIESALAAGSIRISVSDGTVNNQQSVELTGLTKDLRISLSGGNDELVIQGLTLPKNLTVDMGEGANILNVRSMKVNGTTSITLGAGGDLVQIDDSQFVKKWSLQTGAGNDGVFIDRQEGFAGLLQFNNKATVSLGDGDDSLRIGIDGDNTRRATASKPMAINGGNGTDGVAISAQSQISTKEKLIENHTAATLPQLMAGLANDTGVSDSDGLTSDPAIAGTVVGFTSGNELIGGYDNTPLASYVDLSTFVQPKGSFQLSRANLETLFPGQVTDGSHTFHLQVRDAFGESSEVVDVSFVLDSTTVSPPTLDLSAGSDSGAAGDDETSAAIVTLVGQALPGLTVTLLETGATTTANVSGSFQFTNVSLNIGANSFTARVTNAIGSAAEQDLVVTRLNETLSSDIVLDWNTQTLQAIQRDGSDPLVASRILAMESVAVFDVLNAFEGTPGFYVSLDAPAGASLAAAVAAAGHRILTHEFPTQTSVLDAQLQSSLAGVPDGTAKTTGLQFGQAIADAILALREADGSRDFVQYIPATGPGKWGETSPMLMPSAGAHWPGVTPFVIGSAGDFLPDGPPDLDSEQWVADFNQVKELGRMDSATRTAEQTQIARFWSDGQGTYTPPGHWNEIAQRVALSQGTSASANARMFAMLNMAMMDAGIVAWLAKYTFEFWRPITAIPAADTDGNPDTIADPDWQPLLGTPSFPDYVSGHSSFSGAASEVLTHLFGENVAFSSTSIGLPNVTRNFTSFEQAANEAGMSRVYGGIHYLSADLDGLAAGHAVGESVIAAFAGVDTQPPRILMDEFPQETSQSVTLTGRVLDSVSGVVSLTARINGAPAVNISFDSLTGAFSIPFNVLVDGTQHIILNARDAVGNEAPAVDYVFTRDTAAPVITITSPTANGQITEGLRLTGTANGTGTRVVALTYAFDDGVPLPITFLGETGSFDSLLNISLLSVGPHVLHVMATDGAGNVTTTDINLTLPDELPLTIVDMEPLHLTSEVGPTFHPKFVFSRPVNPATLTTANFQASVSGQPLDITIVPNADATTAWIFFADDLPGGATITITVNGSGILGPDGTQLDADGDGTAGGTLVNSFRTVSTTGVLGTTITGYVLDAGPDQIPHDFDDVRAGPDGIINTDDDIYLHPIAGVKVFVSGMEDQAVFTDATGHFVIDPAPTGNVKLVFQGASATNAPAGYYFPEMVMDMESIPGIENWAMEEMPEFYLPRISTTVLHPVSNSEPTVIPLESIAGLNLTAEQAALVSMTVYPGSAVGFDGQVMDNVMAGISVVAADYVRMMLPNGVADMPSSLTIQAPGVARFTIPVSLTVPNIVGLPPGSQTQFISYDHATGLMAVEGTMTVSADGRTITTDPGVGITHPGWHFFAPPPDDSDDDDDDDDDDPETPEDDSPDPPADPPAHAKSKSIPPTQPGNNEHVLLYFPNTRPNPFAIRMRSDDGGHFDTLVPGGQEYQIYIYDPGSGLIATGTGTTPARASQFDPTVGLSLQVSTAPDTDGDGLPDDAEFAIGTDTASNDSDNDGISDLVEVQRNLDPLSNRPLTVGLTSSLDLRGEAKEIVVAGAPQSPLVVTGYVATGSYGLAIVDLSEFRRPILHSELDLPGDATDVAADLTTNIAVVAANAGGLHFVNIADPLQPFLIRTVQVNASHVEILDGVVYAAVGGQLRSFDEITGDELLAVSPGGGTITGLASEGSMLYTMDTGRLLRAIDTTGQTMTLRGSLTLPHGAGKVNVANGIVYAVAANVAGFDRGGFATVDVTNPNSLSLISGADIVSPFVAADNAIAVNGSGLALLVGTPAAAFTFPMLEIYNITDLSTTNTFLQRFALPEEPSAITLGAGIAFIADGLGGLQVINYRAFDNLGNAPTATISTTVTDVAPGTPGVQVVEGTSIPIRVTATDDVQVRSVELLVNGVVQATDLQAPFDFFAIAPAIAKSGNEAAVQVRVTDTGGNSALSNVLSFGLTPDVVPPSVISSSPGNNGVAFDTNAIGIRFNEALDTSLLNLSGVTLTNLGADGVLGGGDDLLVPLVSITAASPNRLVVLPQAPLPKGKFQLVLNQSILSDVAGNDATSNVTLTFTNYINLAPGTIVWASDSNGAWENAANWSSGVVPGPNDNVLIDRIGANPIVTHATGSHTVRSLRTAEPFVISGGSLTINGGTTSLLEGALTVSGGASLSASGAGTIVNATGATNLSGGNVLANNGAVLNLSGVSSLTGANFNTVIEANGANSQLNLPNLATLSGATGNSAVIIRGFASGTVNLPALTAVAGGSTQFFADVGTISAPLLSSFVDDTPSSGTSQIRVDDGGTIQLGNLTTLNVVDLVIGQGTLPVSQFTAITNSSITVEDTATATFTNLATTTGTSFFARSGGILNLPAVTSYAGANFNTFIQTDNANSQLNLPNLATLTGATGNSAVIIRAFSGGTTNLSALTSITGGSTQFHADVGTINAPQLASIVDSTPSSGTSQIRIDAGGEIQFGNLTTLEFVDLVIGLGTLAVSQFTSIKNASITVEDGATATFTSLTTTTGSSFFARSAGILNLPAITSYAGTNFNTFIQTDNANSQVNLPNLATLTGAAGNNVVIIRAFSGGTTNLPLLTNITGGSTQFHADGGTINAPLLTSMIDDTPSSGTSQIRVDTGGTITFGNLTSLDHVDLRLGVGTFAISQFTAITNASITVEDGFNATFANLSTTTGSSFFAVSGGILNLPAVVSYSGVSFNTFFQAENANSQVNLTNLSTLHGGTGSAAVFVRSFSGGKVNLSGLTTIPDQAVQILATGASSVVDISQLTSFTASGSGTSAIQAENGGSVLMPLLTNLQFLDLTLDGASSTLQTSQITNIDTVNVLADNNAVLNLLNVTSYTGSNFNTFVVAQQGGKVNLPNLTTLHGGTGSAGVFIRAFSGGYTNLSGLTSIPDGAAAIFATGTGSTVDLSQLTTFTDTTAATSAIQAENGGNVMMPLLTNLQFVELTLDGATSTMNTSQLTDIDTVDILADNNAVLNLLNVTSYTGSNFNTFLEAQQGGKVNLPNLTTLHGGTGSAAVFIRAFSGGDINLSGLTSIPDGAASILATGNGSSVDLSQLTAFTDTTAATSAIQAENGGSLIMPLLTNLQFVELTLDGATSTMNTSQLTDIDTVNILADNNAVLDLLNVTSYTGSNFNTFLEAQQGGKVNLPNLTTLHGGTGSAAVFIRAFSGGDINLSGLTSIPDGAASILATGNGSSVDLSQLTTFTDTTAATSAIQAESGGSVSMPLLTNLQFVDLTLDGAASTMNTSQLTDVDTVNLLADNNAVFNLPGVTAYSGANFNTFLEAQQGGTLNLPNLATLHGGISGAAVFIRTFSGGDINLPALTSVPDGSVQIIATTSGSVIDLSQLTMFNDTASAQSVLTAATGATLQLGTTITVTNVDVGLDSASTMTVGTLVISTGSRLLGTGTLTGNLTNGGGLLIGSSGGNNAGKLTVTGNYIQTAAGSINIQIGGVTPGTQFDQLVINGSVMLDGTLNLSLINSFNPLIGNVFQILVSSAVVNSQFVTVNGTSVPGSKTFVVGYNPANVALSVV